MIDLIQAIGAKGTRIGIHTNSFSPRLPVNDIGVIEISFRIDPPGDVEDSISRLPCRLQGLTYIELLKTVQRLDQGLEEIDSDASLRSIANHRLLD